MSNVTIRDVYAINTHPAGCNLTVVKVLTSEPGLYGLGCATFTYRWRAVTSLVNDYLKPLLVGRDVANIEDLWQMMNANSYWRGGPVINNAISGVDMALWDIKGKMANMPVYDLLGGKCRGGVPVYRHAGGPTKEAVLESVQKFAEQGARYIRIQKDGYGGKPKHLKRSEGSADGVYYDPLEYMNDTLEIFEYVAPRIDPTIRLLHDTHERLAPIDAVKLAKELEPYPMMFLEDVLSPEQGEWYQRIRQQCATPLALGELFVNPKELDYLVSHRLIDFVRCHVSAYGGITPCHKLAHQCEMFGVRTAWHGPGDVSPVGHAANIHMDLAESNFGIQEWSGPDEREILMEMFPGIPQLKDGYVYANDKPGLGIDIDEALAAKFPCDDDVTVWTQTRIPDGTYNRP